MKEESRQDAGQASKVVSNAYCQGQGFPSVPGTQREKASGHGAWSLNKRTAFHHSPWIHPTGDTCLRGFPSGNYFIGFQF